MVKIINITVMTIMLLTFASNAQSQENNISKNNNCMMESDESKSGRKIKSESFRQKMLRKLYHTLRKMAKKGKHGIVLLNKQKSRPISSIYDMKVVLNNGDTLRFSAYTGKKALLVNTASDCGYTRQYEELQSLHERMGDTLLIIAFPANDFANQEKNNDKEIAQFCQLNYGVTFPIALKSVVIKNYEQQSIFKWLSDKNLNGWNEHAPDWNFSKYIVDENGILTHYFEPTISPLEEDVLNALK